MPARSGDRAYNPRLVRVDAEEESLIEDLPREVVPQRRNGPNIFKPEEVRALGFTYHSVGRD